jgi:hypothetical protein
MTGCNSAIKAAPAQCAGVAERGSISRACSAIAISASIPIAQTAGPGRPAKMIAAMIRSMMSLASIQPHRPDSSRLCSSANIIEATPSITKNTMRTKAKREDAAQRPQQEHDTDRNSKDRRDERQPETRRLAHPEGGDQTDDSADEKEPANRISTASVAMGGITMAARPRMTRIIPSFSPVTSLADAACY